MKINLVFYYTNILIIKEKFADFNSAIKSTDVSEGVFTLTVLSASTTLFHSLSLESKPLA